MKEIYLNFTVLINYKNATLMFLIQILMFIKQSLNAETKLLPKMQT